MEKDQAERLRNQAENLNEGNHGSLPSRKEVHQRKKENKKEEQKNKKSQKPSLLLTKILLFAFIALVVAVVTYQFWSDKIFLPVHSEIKQEIKQVKIEQ